jgi:hypothetical protein
MATEHSSYENTNVDSLEKRLISFREIIVNNFGTRLNYTFIKSEKYFSTDQSLNTPANSTAVLIEFFNDEEVGLLFFLFDDESKKILKVNMQDIKEKLPNMIFYWLFGIFAICVPIFNIYVIRKIRRTELKRKWLKYIAVIFGNIPSITYNAVSGLAFKYLNFQFLLGISFNYGGYLNSYWTFGIPLGGLYWFWKLKKKNSENISEISAEAELNIDKQNEIKN